MMLRVIKWRGVRGFKRGWGCRTVGLETRACSGVGSVEGPGRDEWSLVVEGQWGGGDRGVTLWGGGSGSATGVAAVIA